MLHSGFECIYTLQHIPDDDNFYLVCRQSRSLTLPLHCNTHPLKHLDHENLSLCVLSTFSTYHGRTYLLSVLLSVFQTAVTQPHSKSFILRHQLHCLRNIQWHCIDRVFIILWHTITKCIFRRLDKQWYQCFIDLITYNMAGALPLLHDTLSETTTLFTLIVNISVICLCL